MAPEIVQSISVEGMTCPHCEASVTRTLSKLDGIDEVVADRNSAQVKITGTKINQVEIEQVITDLGYKYKGIIE